MTDRWHGYLDRQVAARPTALAIRDSTGAQWDYATLDAACQDVQRLLQESGVAPGDRVLLLAENCATAVAVLFACSRLGAWVVPVNARQTAREVDRIIAHARPAAVLVTADVSADARAHGDRMETRAHTGRFGVLHLARPHASNPEADREVAVTLYTTGTTGEPKGVMITHANMVYAGQAARAFRSLEPGDLVYGVAPMAHVIGLASMLTAAICAGATVWLEARFSVERLYGALNAGVTHLPAVPQMHALLMQHVQAQGHKTLSSPHLAYVSSGGAPLDPTWKRKAEAFYGLPLQNGYGMTETTAAASISRSQIGDPDVSVGPPLPGVEFRIDESVPGGGAGAGEVITRGPNVMKGYYHNPDETARVLDADGWLRTGDLGRIDDQGRLHILGRTKELIIHGGFNVYPPEVEAALNDHPKVIQSAVVGRMVDGDEKVMAFVQVAEGDAPDPDDLRAFVAERLTGYKRPHQIIMTSSLPAAPNGKLLKHKLLEVFADQFS